MFQMRWRGVKVLVRLCGVCVVAWGYVRGCVRLGR